MSRSAYLPVVINRAPSQADQTDRMIQHCRDLDGTELIVLEDTDFKTEKLAATNKAIRRGLEKMKGRAFIWLEADSPPLKAGWRAAISADYKKVGKPFLMPYLNNGPHDIASGIGVYPPDAWWLLPKEYPEKAWDSWMEKHMGPVIGRTKLIQHAYMNYGADRPWEFPRDKKILDPKAMIFHKDGGQTLIDCFKKSPYVLDLETARPSNKPPFRHGGDIGDVIAALPILRAMGGGPVILFHDPIAPIGKSARESLEGKRYEALKPLLEAQPYVDSVEWGGVISTVTFRETLRPRFESLLERQARHVNRWPIDESPWLTIPTPVEKHQRVICCRSPRYHYDEFPWKEVGETYGDRLLFVGLPDEHKDFEGALGRRVEWARTENFLDIARIMAGAPMVIANQSSPLWVALGLGVKVLVEGDIRHPNTQVPRPGSFWVYTHEHVETVRRAFKAVRDKQQIEKEAALSGTV